jgi:uncharacterized membrane protein
VLLFALSMIPFSTSYLGMHFGSPLASALYAVSLLAPGLAFMWLQSTIKCTGADGSSARAYYMATQRKGLAAAIAYALAVPLGLYAPYAGVTLAGAIGLFWILPYGPLDRLLAGRA